jgi:glycolate oxidase
LEVVLSDGEVTILGGKPGGRIAGYNLAGLIAGSRDTLAVITKIHLKLTPLPRYAADLLVVFPDREAAARLVPRIMSGETVPAHLEYVDSLTINAAERYLNCKLPHGNAGACLIVVVEDNDEDRAAIECETLDRLCREHGAVEIFIGDNMAARQRIWQPSQCHPRSLQSVSRDCRVEDIFVPVARIPDVLNKINSLAGQFSIKVACCGHAGDGQLHAVPIREEQGEQEWQAGRENLLAELRLAVRAMGGQVLEQSACPTKDKLSHQADPVQFKMIRAIKAALDPNQILNPDLLRQQG